MANQSDEPEKPAGRFLTPEELRAELDAVWPESLPRPGRAWCSSDGLRWKYWPAKPAKEAA